MKPLKKIFNMFNEPSREEEEKVTWITLRDEDDLNDMLKRSASRPQLIYKHSTICSFSRMAKSELMASSEEIQEKADINYLGVIESRSVSNKIASELGVRHESPQVIIVKNKKATWNASHGGVRGNNILDQL